MYTLEELQRAERLDEEVRLEREARIDHAPRLEDISSMLQVRISLSDKSASLNVLLIALETQIWFSSPNPLAESRVETHKFHLRICLNSNSSQKCTIATAGFNVSGGIHCVRHGEWRVACHTKDQSSLSVEAQRFDRHAISPIGTGRNEPGHSSRLPYSLIFL